MSDVQQCDIWFDSPASKDRRDCKMVLTLNADDHFSFKMSRQMLPCSSTLGWKQGVSNVMSGAL